MTPEYVAKVLMRRDEISMEEAMDMIRECVEAIRDCGYDCIESEELMADILGLEPDYMFAVLETINPYLSNYGKKE